jgi:hypothetical protein
MTSRTAAALITCGALFLTAPALADDEPSLSGPVLTPIAPPVTSPVTSTSPAPMTPSTNTDATVPEVSAKDVKNEVPILAYTYQAYGASKGTVGAQAYGLGLGASGQKGILGGGVTVWGAPMERLTLIGDAQRNVLGNFAPSVAAVFRLLGTPGDGWSLGALGKFKVDGFTGGPTKDEMESEIELGLLTSYVREGWHLDLNAIAGRGTGDDGETDAEGRLRIGKDVSQFVRLGIDGQARVRMAGPKYLPNGQIWDFAAGPQIMIGSRAFFGALTGGPATMGLLSPNLGWTVVATVGGATL